MRNGSVEKGRGYLMLVAFVAIGFLLAPVGYAQPGGKGHGKGGGKSSERGKSEGAQGKSEKEGEKPGTVPHGDVGRFVRQKLDEGLKGRELANAIKEYLVARKAAKDVRKEGPQPGAEDEAIGAAVIEEIDKGGDDDALGNRIAERIRERAHHGKGKEASGSDQGSDEGQGQGSGGHGQGKSKGGGKGKGPGR